MSYPNRNAASLTHSQIQAGKVRIVGFHAPVPVELILGKVHNDDEETVEAAKSLFYLRLLGILAGHGDRHDSSFAGHSGVNRPSAGLRTNADILSKCRYSLNLGAVVSVRD